MAEELNIIEQEEAGEDLDSRYIVHVENFDGPLGLLWELIKKSKVDITEVSLADITDQFCKHLELMKQLNVRVAVEFIWMASELLYYKSKALLPTDDLDDEYFVPPLPPELVQKLLEYKRFQAASREMFDLFEVRSDTYVRENDVESMIGAEEYIDVSLFDLLRAFADVMESQKVIEEEEIIFDEILVSDRISTISEMLKDNESILFTDIFSGKVDRPVIIASFLAILEMAKAKMIKLMQHRMYGEIRIFRAFDVATVQ